MAKTDNSLNIKVSHEIAEGHYSNLVLITHSPTEFTFDFAQMLPGLENNEHPVRTRVLMNPVHAKRLLYALQDNINKYERNFGVIVEPGTKSKKRKEEEDDDTVDYEMISQGKA